MTDYEKIKAYYSVFDEQHRLEKAEGRLEFDISIEILLRYLNKEDCILDLGGGAGKYSFELANRAFRVTLADLSEHLLEQAKASINEKGFPQLQGIDFVNAVDLSRYKNESFNAVILFGPLYHLLDRVERNQCISEVYRVLKPDGLVFASFIPFLSGLAGVVNRAMFFPDQVDADNLSNVFRTGRFNNNANRGFQEGYFPTSQEIVQLFRENHFTEILLRSIRGLGYNKEEKLYELSERDKPLFDTIIELINKNADNPSIIETCGHAMYIARKCI